MAGIGTAPSRSMVAELVRNCESAWNKDPAYGQRSREPR
jgi:hypothetical protein